MEMHLRPISRVERLEKETGNTKFTADLKWINNLGGIDARLEKNKQTKKENNSERKRASARSFHNVIQN